MQKRFMQHAKKSLSLLVTLAMLAAMVPSALAFDGPPPDFGGGDDWQGEAGLGNSTVNKAPRNYDHTVITDVTAITDVETEANANKLNYYITGATVTGKAGDATDPTTATYTGLMTVIGSDGTEIGPTVTTAGETVSVSYDGIGEENKATVVFTDYIQDIEKRTVNEVEGDYLASMGTEGTSPDMAYRTALYVKDGEVDENSITQAVRDNEETAEVSAAGLTNASITAESSGFSGVIVKTSDDAEAVNEVTISKSVIDLDSESDGTDVNDFAGYGAAVASYGDKTLTVIEDSTVTASGVAKAAVFVDTGADLVVKNSTLRSTGGRIYEDYELTSATNKMVAPPWVLGVAGTARTSNLMGKGSTATFVDSTIEADSWGALSVDSGSDIVMTTINSTVDTTKVGGDPNKVNGAYGAFGIGSTQEYMYGLDMDTDNYAWVMLGATVNLDSSKTDKEYTIKNAKKEEVTKVASKSVGRNTTIDSGNFGFMMSAFGAATNTVNVGADTAINTENAVFLYKAGDAVVDIDSASVTSKSGVLFQAIDNEDSIVGDMTKGFSEPEGWSSTWYAGEEYQGKFNSSGKTAQITVKDSTLEGDIYNGTGYFYTAGGMFGTPAGIFGAHEVNVDLTGSTQLTGVIASTEIQHGDWTDKEKGEFTTNKEIGFRAGEGGRYDTALATEGAMKLGHVVNQNHYNGYNDVNVTVSGGAKWVVSGDSMVTDLIVADRSSVTADKPVTVTVYGSLFLDGKLVTEDTTVGKVTYHLADKPTGEQTLTVNGLLTLTIDGKEVPLDTEIPQGADAVLTVTNYLQADGTTVGKLSGSGNGAGRPYRTALFVDQGEFVADRSVTAVVQNNGGKTAAYDGDGIENISVSAGSTGFSGIILNEAGAYTVQDSKVVLDTKSDGTDANDFSGYGSAVAVFGDTQATIQGADIETTGVAVSGLVVDGGADVVLKDSTITTHGGTIYKDYQQTAATSTMIAPPWDLGLTGNVRAVNVMGTEGTFTMVDSTINAANWAGVSTDGATRLRITGINSQIDMADSGYGVLSIGQGTQTDLYGMDINAQTFIGVYMDTSTINISGSEVKTYPIYSLMEGDAGDTHAASRDNTEDQVAEIAIGEGKISRLTSDSFGFMFNVMMGSGNKINYLNLGDGVEMETGNAAFLAKSDGANIVVDGAKITVKDGVLLQAMDNPGASIGLAGGQTLNTTYEEPEGWSSTWEEDVKHGKRLPTNLTLTNTDIEGSVYNGTGYDKDGQGGAKVNVTIGENASLTGALASTEIMHSTDGGETQNNKIAYLDESEGYDHDTVKEAAHKLNHVANQPYFNGYNEVNVTVADGGEWVVTKDSMVNDVHVDSASSITAEEAVTITVYGTLTLGETEYTYDADNTESNTQTVGNVTYELVENTLTKEIEPDEGGGSGGGPGGGFPDGGYNPPESADDMADPNYAYMTLENVRSVTVTDSIANVNGLEVDGIDNNTPVAATVTLGASADEPDPGHSSSGGRSGSSATYAITLADASNGNLKSDRSRASKGATVTLTVTPDAGYALSSLTATTAAGGTVSLTKKSDTKYTFTMPGSKVTVKAEFQPEAQTAPIVFTDVEAGSYYEEAVKWAVAQNVTTGTGGAAFSPDAVCTRAQMVTFLWRAAGSPTPTGTAHAFTDVDAGSYYYQAMLWAVEQGITTGTGDATFSPDAVCTRSQTVAFLWRASGAPAAESASHPFTDVDAGSYYEQAVIWAVEQGITTGTGAAVFSPAADCTRAQIVTFLYRAFA